MYPFLHATTNITKKKEMKEKILSFVHVFQVLREDGLLKSTRHTYRKSYFVLRRVSRDPFFYEIVRVV